MLNLLMPFAGSLVSGGASLLGAQMSSNATARNARLNAIYQAGQNQIDRDINAANFAASQDMAREQFGIQTAIGNAQFERQMAAAEQDRALQKEFAQNGVQWRVADAKAAGLHPLAALSAQLHSPSPVQVSGHVPSGNVPSAGSVSSNSISPFAGGEGIGSGLASMGQDLSRAMTAAATEWERSKGVETASQALSLENQALQNKLLASQLAKTTGAAVGPSMPSNRSTNMIDGQGNTPLVVTLKKTPLIEEQKHEPVVGHPSAKHSEPGEITDLGFSRTATGYAPVPSKDVKERIEDNLISELMWEARNRITQSLGFGLTPPKHVPLKKDHEWYFNPLRQEYQQRIAPYDKKSGNWRWSEWYNSKTH